MSAKRGIHEERTRLWLYLPHNNPQEALVFFQVIDLLQAKRTAVPPITGFTHSRPIPSPYVGWWWSDDQQMWIEDVLVLVVIDYERKIHDRNLPAELEALKQEMAQLYTAANSRQEEIWLVAHPVWRYD